MICADEKTSIQARARKHSSLTTRPGRAMRIEHEYKRLGAWAYLAALDVHQFRIFGRCERKNGIVGFDRLVAQTMRQRPAKREGSSGSSTTAPPTVAPPPHEDSGLGFPNLVLVHGPIHASWLNQIEIYFSVLQRKVLTPNDFASLSALKEGILQFQRHYPEHRSAVRVAIHTQDLATLLRKLDHTLAAA